MNTRPVFPVPRTARQCLREMVDRVQDLQESWCCRPVSNDAKWLRDAVPVSDSRAAWRVAARTAWEWASASGERLLWVSVSLPPVDSLMELAADRAGIPPGRLPLGEIGDPELARLSEVLPLMARAAVTFIDLSGCDVPLNRFGDWFRRGRYRRAYLDLIPAEFQLPFLSKLVRRSPGAVILCRGG